MAKIYKDAVPPVTGRAYQVTENGDGTKKITDVTRYDEEGTPFSASDVLESCTLVFTHTKSGTVHNFTNPNPTAKMGRAKMTANVAAGDTFQVNGVKVTAYIGAEAATDIMAGSSYNGKWVSFIIDGTTLNFNGGGGLPASEKDKIIPGNLKTGVSIKVGSKTVTGTFTADANAAASQILSGKTAYVKGAKVTGNIPSKSAATYRPGTANQTINPGQYLSGAQTIQGDGNLQSNNIRSGVSIFGVSGSITPRNPAAYLACSRLLARLPGSSDDYRRPTKSVGWADSTYGRLSELGYVQDNSSGDRQYIWTCTRNGNYYIQVFGDGSASRSGQVYLSSGNTVVFTLPDAGDIYWRDMKCGGMVIWNMP